MALEHVPRCQHVKVNGVQCGSPALRRRAHCYFHTRVEHERQAAVENREGKRTFGFPLLEDANSIQVALMRVIQMLGAGTMDHKTASLMLYALQTASYNLRNTRFEPEKATEVVIDEDTVDLTRIAGPQWAARDFPSAPPAEVQEMVQDDFSENELPEEEAPQNAPSAAMPAPAVPCGNSAAIPTAPRPIATQKPATVAVDPVVADTARRREQKRKLQRDIEQAMEDEPDSLAAVLLKRLGLPLRDEEEDKEQPRAQSQLEGAPS